VAYVLIERSEHARAAQLLGTADAIREAGDARMAFDEEPEYAAALDRLRAAMGDSTFDAASSAGRAMSQADAVAIALQA